MTPVFFNACYTGTLLIWSNSLLKLVSATAAFSPKAPDCISYVRGVLHMHQGHHYSMQIKDCSCLISFALWGKGEEYRGADQPIWKDRQKHAVMRLPVMQYFLQYLLSRIGLLNPEIGFQPSLPWVSPNAHQNPFICIKWSFQSKVLNPKFPKPFEASNWRPSFIVFIRSPSKVC